MSLPEYETLSAVSLILQKLVGNRGIVESAAKLKLTGRISSKNRINIRKDLPEWYSNEV
jgi:hypothetical protein